MLPFAPEDFATTSVLIGGEAWLQRFDACQAAARAVETLGHDAQSAGALIPDSSTA